MGILDDTQFDLSSYGGNPSGWLGALLQPQSGAAPGFAPDATQMPPSFPPAAAGMAKGTVTPQIGADAMGKDPGASNPFTDFLASLGTGIGNAFLPSPAAAPAGPQAAPSLLDRLSAGATNFATGGSPIGGVLNSVRGLATGERTDPVGIRQANQRATFNALVGAGVAPQFAHVAALNPDILKTVVAAHFNALPPQTNRTPALARDADAPVRRRRSRRPPAVTRSRLKRAAAASSHERPVGVVRCAVAGLAATPRAVRRTGDDRVAACRDDRRAAPAGLGRNKRRRTGRRRRARRNGCGGTSGRFSEGIQRSCPPRYARARESRPRLTAPAMPSRNHFPKPKLARAIIAQALPPAERHERWHTQRKPAPVTRPAHLANQPGRPLDARLANLRRLLLSGPAVLPLVRPPRPSR